MWFGNLGGGGTHGMRVDYKGVVEIIGVHLVLLQ